MGRVGKSECRRGRWSVGGGGRWRVGGVGKRECRRGAWKEWGEGV